MKRRQWKSLEGDPNDVDTSKTRLEDAYITELRNSRELASDTNLKVHGIRKYPDPLKGYTGNRFVAGISDDGKLDMI